MLNNQTRCSEDELEAVRARFDGVVERWKLTQSEAAELLGQGNWREACLTSDAEARLRHLCDIDALLDLFLDDAAASDWIRAFNQGFVGGLTPLAAMSQGRHVIRGVRNVLQELGEKR